MIYLYRYDVEAQWNTMGGQLAMAAEAAREAREAGIPYPPLLATPGASTAAAAAATSPSYPRHRRRKVDREAEAESDSEARLALSFLAFWLVLYISHTHTLFTLFYS